MDRLETPITDRYPKSRAEIERLVLDELRAASECTGAAAVWVVPIEDDAGANWTVSYYDVGTAKIEDCDLAMEQIVPRLQGFYELVEKH